MRFNKEKKNTRIASVFESLITKENSIPYSIVLTVSFNHRSTIILSHRSVLHKQSEE